MIDLLSHFFGALCGQNPEHTWAPGGMLLPCCQRCTGLYVGALVALALHLWLKPRLSNRFLLLHGLFLLQMVPFGFHWVPQGPALRTVTGILYAFGVVTFLWLVPAGARQPSEHRIRPRGKLGYGLGLAACVALLPVLAAYGGQTGGKLLPWLAFGGAVGLAVLVTANLGFGALAVAKLCLRIKTAASA